MDALKAELLERFPYFSDAEATRLIGYVLEAFLDRLRATELPAKWKHTFEVRVMEAAESLEFSQFDSYSENGLSVALNRDALTRGITPIARIV